MRIRNLQDSDYETLCDWWCSWGWKTPPSKDILPENGTGGIVVMNEGVPICAGFLYLVSNAPIAWMTFPVSNPAIRRDLRKDSLRMMVDVLVDLAKQNGCRYVYSSLRNQGMIEVQKSCGFIEGDKQHTELIKVIL